MCWKLVWDADAACTTSGACCGDQQACSAGMHLAFGSSPPRMAGPDPAGAPAAPADAQPLWLGEVQRDQLCALPAGSGLRRCGAWLLPHNMSTMCGFLASRAVQRQCSVLHCSLACSSASEALRSTTSAAFAAARQRHAVLRVPLPASRRCRELAPPVHSPSLAAIPSLLVGRSEQCSKQSATVVLASLSHSAREVFRLIAETQIDNEGEHGRGCCTGADARFC